MIDPREWLAADGLGGYASGCADGTRTRRYHALLLVASPRTEERFALVNGLEAWVETDRRAFALSSQRYVPGVVHPDGLTRLVAFTAQPWPTWTYQLAAGLSMVQELFAVPGRAAMVLRWRVVADSPAGEIGPMRLSVRLLCSGRDWHSLHRENATFRFDATQLGAASWEWMPYAGVPPVLAHTDGRYSHEPTWYRQFEYDQERARGLEYVEDLASPGVLTWALGEGDSSDGGSGAVASEANLILTTSNEWLGLGQIDQGATVESTCRSLREKERARVQSFATRLVRSADAYLVTRGERRTIIAGYPWFTDWGRDTFVSVRGLCLATGRLDDAASIVLSWSSLLRDGMMPNFFPSHAAQPQYNSVDASLWFIVAVEDVLQAPANTRVLSAASRQRLIDACMDILAWYSRGTQFGIRADRDGLLAAGEPGATLALTWMDAIVGERPVTPRVGKPVELQALWYHALSFGARYDATWGALAERARESFAARFWNPSRRCLYDVVDVNHRSGTADALLRPNQIFACGGLPVSLLDGERARHVVDVVENALWTPAGLRSLAPGEPGYAGECIGPPHNRDAAYHQGAIWPWLTAAFVDAWIRSRGGDVARRAAYQRFLSHWNLDVAGIGHVFEIADGDPPYEPRGCPFQAWSVGEMVRALRLASTS